MDVSYRKSVMERENGHCFLTHSAQILDHAFLPWPICSVLCSSLQGNINVLSLTLTVGSFSGVVGTDWQSKAYTCKLIFWSMDAQRL